MTTDTRYKLEEAEFFLGFLETNYGKQKKFDFYLSAYFGAARAVTWIMRSEYSKVEGWEDWFKRLESDAEEERLLAGIKDLRNRSLKSEPLRTLVETHLGDLYTDTPGEHAEAEKIMGRIVRENIPMAIGGSSGKYRIEAVIDGRPVCLHVRQAMFHRRLKEFPDEHILTICNKYYKFLKRIVAECEARFSL